MTRFLLLLVVVCGGCGSLVNLQDGETLYDKKTGERFEFVKRVDAIAVQDKDGKVRIVGDWTLTRKVPDKAEKE